MATAARELLLLLLSLLLLATGIAGVQFLSPLGANNADVYASVTIPESTTVSTNVYTIRTAADCTFSITNTGGATACGDGATGEVKLHTVSGNEVQLQLNKQLDYETQTTYACDVRCGGKKAVITIYLTNVYDEAPTTSVTSITGTATEEQPPGTEVALSPAIVFSDSEVAASGDVVTCSLTGTGSDLFQAVTTATATGCTCKIRMKDKLDRDTMSQTSFPALTVVATDKGSKTATIPLTITVADINDNSPVCSATYAKTVVEETAGTTDIVTVACTDADAGVNAVLVYSAGASNPAGYTVSAAGLVQLTTTKDYDTMTTNPELVEVAVRDSATTAADRLTSTATVTVTIMPTNDNTPSITIASKTKTVPETAGVGVILFSPTASDGDKSGEPDSTLTWSIVSATTAGSTSVTTSFSIDSSTGVVSLGTGGLNYETWKTADIVVKVSDAGSPVKTAVETLTLSVTDVNELPPTFTPSAFYKVSLTENNQENFTVLNTFSATDPDGSGLPVWCEIVSGNTDSVFRFNETNRNVLELAKTIEPDSPTNHPLIFLLSVECKDNNGTSPYKSSTATIEVDITTVNDNTPAIAATSGCTTVSRCSESTTLPGTKVADIIVSDNDASTDGEFDCSIVGPAGAPFSLQGCTAVMLSGSLDYETATSYALRIRAKDRGSPSRERTETVNIYVDDVDDNAPYCLTYDYTFTVNENAAVNDAVGIVNCLDRDNAGVTYTLVPATVPFKVEDATNKARVRVKNTLDYESRTEYVFTVRTTDKGTFGRTTDAVVRVQVQPINEQTPTFSDTTISVAEDTTPGTIVTTFAAADSDTGGHGIVSYAIQSATNTGENFFSISNTGQVALIKALDYETHQQYVLTVRATDGASATGTGLLTINIADKNDNAPICSSPVVSLSMPETDTSSTVATGTHPSATDADSNVLYGKLKYSISAGDTGSYFSINSATGQISRSTTPGLSYEALTPPGNYYNLTVLAIDEDGVGPNTATCSVRLTITDVEEGAPVFSPSVASVTFAETTAVGTVIYTPSYTHVDKWDIPTFTFSAANTQFSVEANTGKITLAKQLDYEAADKHVLNIVATDKNSNANTMILTVTVTNANEFSPICSPTSTTVYIDENDQSSPSFPKTVMTFSCSDGDAGTTLLYSVVKVDGVATAGPYQFVGAELRTSAALNYDTATPNTNDILEITISDQGPGTANVLTVTVTVSINPVNEYAPVFTASSLTPGAVDENLAVGGNVAQLLATDDDKGSDHATIRFGIIAGNDKGYFTLNENTGWVTSMKSLDREDSDKYLLTVTATDGPGLKVTSTLTISLNDVNDNRPQFTQTVYSVSVSENAVSGTTIFSFTGKVSDADATSPNNAVKLTLETASVPFEFPAGAPLDLKTKAALNAETNPSYSLTVRATDNNGVASATTLTADVLVIVNVLPVNLNPPSFSGTNSISLPEDTAVGSAVFNATATDTDSGLGGVITYSFASGNTNNDFVINPNTGTITLNKILDFDSGTTTYSLNIMAKDNGSPSKTAYWTLTVTVTDVNDNAPIWSASNTYSQSVSESTTGTPKTIYNMLVSDPDAGVNGEIVYSLVSQSGTAPDGTSPLFAVEATSGAIRLLHQPDREFASSYNVLVQACDKATAPLCSQKLFVFAISDANDNTPTFGLCPKEITVAEGTGANVLIATLPAADADANNNGQIASYSLVSADGGASSPSGLFVVSSSGGVTTDAAVTATSLDRETKSVYQFFLRAEDNGTPSRRTGSCLLNVTVGDKNDNAPVVGGQPIVASVSEAAAGGTIFYAMSVTDADIGVNAALLFRIDAFTPANNFSINNKGQLSLFTSHRLDRERHAAYNLTVWVGDQGTDPGQRTATVTVSVDVLDVNDNTPSFGAASIGRSVAENSAVDATVGGVVAATDPDLGENASLTYQIAAVLVPTSGGDYFKIDPLTGQIRVKVAALDRETRDLYVLRLVAMDNGSPALTGTTTVTVTITDVNDNTPTFSTSYTSGVSVDENSAAGTSVVTFAATDADIGVNGEIVYALDTTRLNGSLANTYFQIDSATGALTVKSPIDRETYSMLQFYVLAEDKGSPVRTGSASVNVYINDVNDNTPVFNPSFYNTEMYYKEERTSVTLATVRATDADVTGNVVQYSWGSSSANFVLNPATGVITPAASQATSKDSLYLHYVTATDSASVQRTATATVRIDTFDMNEVGVCITYTSIYSTFITKLAAIEASLESTLHFKYPTVRCETWKYTAASSSVRACHYCVQDNSTDSAAATAAPKSFVTQSELLIFWRLDTEGTPTAMLQSSSFSATPVTLVEGYSDSTTTATDTTPWYQTPWGIAVLVLCSVLAASLIGVGIGTLVYCLKTRGAATVSKPLPKRTPAPPRQHPKPPPQTRANRNQNVYRDRKLWRGTPEFGRSYENSPGERQRTGHSPGNSRTPTPVS